MFDRLKRLLTGTLRRQLIVGMVLVVALMMSLFVWDMIQRQQAVLIEQQSDQAVALAHSVSTSAAVWVASRDFSGLQEIIQGLSHYPDLRHAIVLDLRGQVLAHSDPTRRGLYLTDLPQEGKVRVLQRTASLADVASPVMLAGRQIGWVRIGLARDSLEARFAQVTRDGVFYALIAIALSALVAALAGRYLTRRLYTIQRVANAVQAGESGLRAVVPGDDEAAQLARQFNGMLDTMAQREETLRQVSDRLSLATRAGGVGVWDLDIIQNILTLDDQMFALYGITRDQFGGTYEAWKACVLPEDVQQADAEIQMSLRNEKDFDTEFRVLWPNGNIRNIRALANVERDASGQPLRMIGTNWDITERKQAELEATALIHRNQVLMDNALEGIHILDDQGNLMEANHSFCRLLGYTQEEARHLNVADWEEKMTPDELKIAIRQLLDGHAVFETLNRRKDGSVIDVEISVVGVELDGRKCLYVSSRDITARKQAEEKLQLAASVFTHAREGITITTADGTIIDVNETFTRITGYSRDEVLGQNPRILSSGLQDKEFYVAMWRDLIEKGHWYGEIWNRRKNGEVYAEMLTISSVRDAQGKAKQYVALFSDITELKEHEQKLEHIAHYDALTNLPNRVLLADRLHQGMVQAQRHAQRLAVAYLDLDGFKAINDNHGHEAGDQLLMTVSTRMKHALREGDTLSRLGGDEFVAVLLDLSDIETSVPMLTRLLVAAARPVQVGDLVLQVSASLGVTFYPQAGDVDADQLLRQADQAMYQAKLAGKNRYHVFDAEQDSSIRGHHESLERIRRALTVREFVLYYQPKVNMRTGTIIGAEALIRWQHPEKGLLPPAVFLPVIEDHMLSVEIGEWVIDTALTQVEHWRAAGLDIPVSVNIGARQLQQANFVERLCYILAAHPENMPSCLELEVLETSALEDVAQVSQIINACREIGVKFALDDFGTGYSSLTYLKRLPVTTLKIDQTFVRDMLDDPDDLAILQGVLGLATAFRRQAIAEGVETVEHGTLLLQLGCELAQGYGIARPMPAHEMPGWSTIWRPDPAWANLASVTRDDLPLLFASVDHRAWIVAFEAFLKGEREAPMPLDHHQCRFGMWLDAEGLTRHGAHPAFHAIESLHRQVHALAAELLGLHTQGRNPEALARLPEFHGLRDALLEQLKVLAQGNR